MLSENEVLLMRLILTDREAARNKLLSERDIKIVNFISKRQSITSLDLMLFLKCSIENASSTVKRLYTKKYLTRVDVGDPTGGSLHLYTINSELTCDK